MKVLLLILFPLLLLAKVEIKTNPARPVKGDIFEIIFELHSPHDENSQIEFNPLGLEILGKEIGSRSTRTTYINGKLSVEKKVSVIYQAKAESIGIKYLNSIHITTEGNKQRIPSKSIHILDAPERAREFFLQAEVNKEEVYVGESIVVNYFIYHAIPLQEYQIDRYAKLDKFLKRFHQQGERVERVEHQGQIYTRRTIYSAQVFANSPGEYRIDPMKITVRYIQNADPFGSMFQRSSSRRSVQSQELKLTVKPLPVENVPEDFTGLVGKHTFNFEMPRNKFITNEPIELKLTVDGPGALEVFESPTLLSHPALESFVSDSELIHKADFTAVKSFDYTFLGREPLELPAKDITFSYFDPASESFKLEIVKFPGLTVLPGQGVSKSGGNFNKQKATPPLAQSSSNKTEGLLTGPVFVAQNMYLNYSQITLYVLISLALILLVWKGGTFLIQHLSKREVPLVLEISKRGMSYHHFFQLLSHLGRSGGFKDFAMTQISQQDLRQYWLDLYEQCEENYRKNVNKAVKVDKKKLEALMAYERN